MAKKVRREEPEVREQLINDYVAIGVSRAAMCRLSDRPEEAMLIARSVFPLLVRRLHELHIDKPRDKSADAQLESLKCSGVIDEFTHDQLREGAVGLSEYGSSRNCTATVDACVHMLRLMKHGRLEAVKQAQRDAEAARKPASEGRVKRLAAAAVGLFTLGS